MNPELQKAIKEQINNLPEEIRALVLGDEWKMWVGSIVKKNTLNLDQASTLEGQVFLFLIGLNGVFELRKGIQEEMLIPVSKVNDIMIDINDMIIDPLKQKLIASTSDDEIMQGVPRTIADTIALKDKEDEILDRQKVLQEIEQSSHARGVGVYVPDAKREAVLATEVKKIQPIAQNNQLNTPASQPKIAAAAPMAEPSPAPEPAKPFVPPARHASIFEAKTSAIVAPASIRSSVDVITSKLPTVPLQEKKPAPSAPADPYREPVI